MCGISGIFKLDGSSVDSDVLGKMTDVISHRGPDGFGYWFNANNTLGFGHRRLSIIDLSVAGAQPMSYMGLTITFNGEIYNYLELKKDLISKGYAFSTETDTEVLLALYHLKGESCLQELDGMFSFAIWDDRKEELFCARDRFGEKPFYYAHDSARMIFGSEIKQLIAAGISKEPNPETLYNYCANDLVEHPYDAKQTFFKEIYQLPPSHCLTISKAGTLVVKKYWEIDHRNRTNAISFDEALEEFSRLMQESISRRMRADVNVGTSLSGGLDSTTIASYICRNHPLKELNTFTASFSGFEKDETRFIGILKNRYPTIKDHYVSPTAEELADDLENFLKHHDEPVRSTSIYAQYRVMKLAKQHHTTVLLDGQGADEFLGGYNQYWPVRLREMYASKDRNYDTEKKLVKELIGFEQHIDLNLALMLRYPGLHKKMAALKKTFKKQAVISRNNPFKNEFFQEEVLPQKDDTNWADLNSVLNHSILQGGLQELLRYADRNSMAHSREVRLPFLYHKLVEFVFSLPSHYKMNNGWSKLILRKSQDAYLPPEICWRKEKVGYATPQHYWMANKKIEESQNEKRLKLDALNIFDTGFIKKIDSWKVINLSNVFEDK